MLCDNNHLAKANRLVRTKQFAEALVAYNNALQHGNEMTSENRALILRNRSFCLNSLQVGGLSGRDRDPTATPTANHVPPPIISRCPSSP